MGDGIIDSCVVVVVVVVVSPAGQQARTVQ